VARVGQLVLALGRPGESIRAILGVVSGLGGPWQTRHGGSIDAYIDVDGSLPGGFSGGPLVGGDGTFLGINTSRLVPGGTTIPAATVTRVPAHPARGHHEPPWHRRQEPADRSTGACSKLWTRSAWEQGGEEHIFLLDPLTRV
jgi:S1-C subfamily serine protease